MEEQKMKTKKKHENEDELMIQARNEAAEEFEKTLDEVILQRNEDEESSEEEPLMPAGYSTGILNPAYRECSDC